ncbi:hypothetical protein [uncultured Sphingomonas sp.]|uniref:head-tail connector protein n=1 Tax=uncultured Sphingomonas sp. TaxID=158754 RepID=UPI0035CB4444
MTDSVTPVGVLADAGAMVAGFLRLADGAEAALVQRLAAVAIGCAEAFLGASLIVRGFEDVVAADGAWHRLATEPVRLVAGVTAHTTGLPADAAPFVLPVADYRIDIAADGRGWVRVRGGAPLAAVAYTAGLATDWADVPAPIAQGVVAMAAGLFTDRDAATVPSADVVALWRPFRRLRLGDGRSDMTPGGGR